MADIRPNELEGQMLSLLIHATEPTATEVQHLLSARPTLHHQAAQVSLVEFANVTEPTWAEEVRVTTARKKTRRSGRVITWRRATDPTMSEIDRVSPELPTEALQLATDPSSLEVQRLMAALRTSVPQVGRARRNPWSVLAPALLLGAAAAATFALWPAADSYGEPDIASGEVATIPSLAIVDLGPSIDLSAHAVPGQVPLQVRIAQADADGTVVDVLQGGTHFEVDPHGLHRALTVRAGDVEVHVKGTVFTVDNIDHAVFVAVERGRVLVDTPQRSFYLIAGESWSNERLTVRSEPTKTATLAVTAPTPSSTGPHETSVGSTPSHAISLPPSALPPVETKDHQAKETSTETKVVSGNTTVAQVNVEPLSAVDSPSPEPTRITHLRSDMENLAILNQRLGSGDKSMDVIKEIDTFLARKPEVRLVGIALELRLEAAEASHQAPVILGSIDALLAHSPTHPRQVALRLQRAQAHHELGDCAEAIDDYRAVSRSQTTHRSEGFIGQGLCADELALTEEAIESFKRALSYPIGADLRETLK